MLIPSRVELRINMENCNPAQNMGSKWCMGWRKEKDKLEHCLDIDFCSQWLAEECSTQEGLI